MFTTPILKGRDLEVKSWRLTSAAGFDNFDFDNLTIACGSPLDATNGTDSGIVDIYKWDGSDFVFEATVKPPVGEHYGAGHFFGQSVALSGNTLAVYANGNDYEENDTYIAPIGSIHLGAVYIFTRSGTTWTLERKITIGSARVVNTEAISTIRLDTDTLCFHYTDTLNSVKVYTRSGTTWSLENAFSSDDVSGRFDYHGDLIITNKLNNAKVYTRSGTTWSAATTIATTNSASIVITDGTKVAFKKSTTPYTTVVYKNTGSWVLEDTLGTYPVCFKDDGLIVGHAAIGGGHYHYTFSTTWDLQNIYEHGLLANYVETYNAQFQNTHYAVLSNNEVIIVEII